ncbi:MAG: hypothetical protein HQM12_23840 [SAR324 cluster bacterium]|nr:hypothetical protein [SAR324 cluster bacterium]
MENIIVAIIAVVAAWGGSFITGLFAYQIGIKKSRFENLVNKFEGALKDNMTFYNLESTYAEEMAKIKESSSEAIKKQFRKKLREESSFFISENCTPLKIQRELERLQTYK